MKSIDTQGFEPFEKSEPGIELGSENGLNSEELGIRFPNSEQVGIRFPNSEPKTYSELGEILNIGADAIRKQISQILKIHPNPTDLTAKRGRQVVLTCEGQIELHRYRELGLKSYSESLEAILPAKQSGKLALRKEECLEVEILQPVAIPKFEIPESHDINPKDLVETLNFHLDLGKTAISDSLKSISTYAKNVQLLRETLRMAEEQEAAVRGYQRAVKLGEIEAQAEFAYLQKSLESHRPN